MHYYNPMYPKFYYTIGIKNFIEKHEASWITDYIFSLQLKKKIRQEPFQSWVFKVKDNKCNVEVTDGNRKSLYKGKIPFTDLEDGTYKFWFVDNVLLLPEEY